MTMTGGQITFNTQQEGTVAPDGTLQITFSPSAVSQSLYGRVAVIDSTPDIAWRVAINNINQGTVYGSSFSGPYAIKQGQELTLNASNLPPGAMFVATFIGYSITGPNPGVAIPSNLGSVSVINEEVKVAGPIVVTTANTPQSIQVNVQPSWSTLRVWSTSGGIVEVLGDTTGLDYAGAFGTVVKPSVVTVIIIDPVLDPTLTINLLCVSPVTSTTYFVTAQLTSPVSVVGNITGGSVIVDGWPDVDGNGPGNLVAQTPSGDTVGYNMTDEGAGGVNLSSAGTGPFTQNAANGMSVTTAAGYTLSDAGTTGPSGVGVTIKETVGGGVTLLNQGASISAIGFGVQIRDETGGGVNILADVGGISAQVDGNTIQLLADPGDVGNGLIALDPGAHSGDLLVFRHLPTSDPGVTGAIWNNAGVLNISP